MRDEAVVEFQNAALSDDTPWILACLGSAYGLAGRKLEAQRVLDQLRERAQRTYVAPHDLAVMFAGLGDEGQALTSLEKAYEDRCSLMVWFIQIDPMLDTIRTTPRFADFLRCIGRPS